MLVLKHHVEAPVDWRSARKARRERIEVRLSSKDVNTRSRAREGSSSTLATMGVLGKRERKSHWGGEGFARVGSHLPTEPSSRPRPSREKFGLNASSMVSCARHSEGGVGEKERRNCGGRLVFARRAGLFSSVSRFSEPRTEKRNENGGPSKLACGMRGLRKASAERPRDDKKLEARSGSYVEIAFESSRARHCAAVLARRRARPVPRQIRELKENSVVPRSATDPGWKRARAPAYRFGLRPRGCGRDLGSDLELFRVRRELALLRLVTCARSPDSERVAILGQTTLCARLNVRRVSS